MSNTIYIDIKKIFTGCFYPERDKELLLWSEGKYYEVEITTEEGPLDKDLYFLMEQELLLPEILEKCFGHGLVIEDSDTILFCEKDISGRIKKYYKEWKMKNEKR